MGAKSLFLQPKGRSQFAWAIILLAAGGDDRF